MDIILQIKTSDGIGVTIIYSSIQKNLFRQQLTSLNVWSGVPYSAMNIFITSVITIDGFVLDAGDEIGIFDGDNCVGSVLLTEPIQSGGYVQVIASTDDPGTPEIDGFINGHTNKLQILAFCNS